MNTQSASDTVREILASEICDSWVFDWGQMIGQLHGQDLRAGYKSNKVRQATHIYGVELSERLQQIYSNGFDIGINGWPENVQPENVSPDGGPLTADEVVRLTPRQVSRILDLEEI